MLNTNVNANSFTQFTHVLPNRRIVDENVNYFSIQLSIKNKRYLLLFKNILAWFSIRLLYSFYLKLDVLKNPPGYIPRQVCDFAQGDIRSRVPGDLDPREKSGSRTSLLRERVRKREGVREIEMEGEGGKWQRKRERKIPKRLPNSRPSYK